VKKFFFERKEKDADERKQTHEQDAEKDPSPEHHDEDQTQEGL